MIITEYYCEMKRSSNSIIFLMKVICIAFLLVVLFPVFAGSDTIFLKSGEKIVTKKAWEEGDKVKFYFHGMPASVSKSEVLKIENVQDGKKYSPPSDKSGSLKKGTEKTKKAGDKKKAKKTTPLRSVKDSKGKKVISKKDKGTGKKGVSDKKELVAKKRVGFRNLCWGAKVSDIKGLEHIGTDPACGGVEEYINPNDVLKIGEAEIEKIVYGFWQDKLFTVSIWTKNYRNYRLLRNAFFSIHGIGQQRDKNIERYVWSGRETDTLLEYDEERSRGLLWFRSRDIYDGIKKGAR